MPTHTHKAVKFSFCYNQVNLCKGAISRDKDGQLVAWTHFDEKYKQESGEGRVIRESTLNFWDGKMKKNTHCTTVLGDR